MDEVGHAQRLGGLVDGVYVFGWQKDVVVVVAKCRGPASRSFEAAPHTDAITRFHLSNGGMIFGPILRR